MTQANTQATFASHTIPIEHIRISSRRSFEEVRRRLEGIERRRSVITRAFGSPKIPRTIVLRESQQTNTCPKAADGVSILVPSRIHAKYRVSDNAEPPCNPQLSRVFNPKITHSIIFAICELHHRFRLGICRGCHAPSETRLQRNVGFHPPTRQQMESRCPYIPLRSRLAI
jgi:hypothetical protein